MRGTALADVCVLVVSSTMGPQALTREHLVAALSAGISSFVIVINDFDGDAGLLAACELEVRSLLAEHGAAGDDAPIVTGSLRTREGAVAAAVLAAIDALPVVVRDSTASALMRPLFHHPALSQMAVAVDGAGSTVASGRVMAGSLKLGDEVRVIGQRPAVSGPPIDPRTLDLRARVTRLQLDKHEVDIVSAGEHCGLQLTFAGPTPIVGRFSSVIVGPEHPGLITAVMARLTLRAADVGGPRHGLRTGTVTEAWTGPTSGTCTILPVDDNGRDVAVVAAGDSFTAAILLRTGRFADVGGSIALVTAAGVLARGEITELVARQAVFTSWNERAQANRAARFAAWKATSPAAIAKAAAKAGVTP